MTAHGVNPNVGLAPFPWRQQAAVQYMLPPRWNAPNICPAAGMLVHNYRSHSRLLELPSRLYYDDALVALADPQMVAAPLWDELQDPDADPHQDDGLSHGQEHASHPDEGSSSQLQHLSTEHQPHGTQMGAAQLSDKGWQKAEGRELEQVETAQADEGDDGEYSEEEGDSSLTQLPVNTLFYGVRGQQARTALTTGDLLTFNRNLNLLTLSGAGVN